MNSVSPFLIGNLIDAGDSLSAAFATLAKNPTVDGCDILLSRLQGARQGVSQLRRALATEMNPGIHSHGTG
jgi:hypothetical protein